MDTSSAAKTERLHFWNGLGTIWPRAGSRSAGGGKDSVGGGECGGLVESFGEGRGRSCAEACGAGEAGCGGATGGSRSDSGATGDRGSSAGRKTVRRIGVAAVRTALRRVVARVHGGLLRDLRGLCGQRRVEAACGVARDGDESRCAHAPADGGRDGCTVWVLLRQQFFARAAQGAGSIVRGPTPAGCGE
jgi:hypothetical protein